MSDDVLLNAALELIGPPGGRDRPLVLGVCGAQGSGKSTLSASLAHRLRTDGCRVAVLSLDDFYLRQAERRRLAREVHPLLATRGVPGTHDVALGVTTLAALDRGEPVSLPCFDKARDDRAPEREWPAAPPDCEVVIFEGWCVGARPQPERALATPVNALEHDDDPDGTWRRHVNRALARDYTQLFARVDKLMLLAAPGFDVVYGWRRQQEHALRAATGGGMSDAALARFIQHYERLTRWILAEMSGRADCTIHLDAQRRVLDQSSR